MSAGVLDRMDPVTRGRYCRAALGEEPFPSHESAMRNPDAQRGAAWVLQVPGLVNRFQRIPRTHTLQDGEDVVLPCRCGRRVLIREGELVQCEWARAWIPTRAGCSRVFLRARRSAFVYVPRTAA
jgi:hypothetical protein